MRTVAWIALAAAVSSSTACGKKEDGPKSTKQDAGGSAAPKVAPLAVPTIGIDSPKRMNYVYDAGRPDYEKAVVAYKAKPRDWAAIRTACEAALVKDASHLDAHRLLGSALAQLGEHAAAVDHLITAVTGDYYKNAPSIAADEDLKDFLATPHGQSVTDLLAKLEEATAKKVAGGVWLVARRSTFKWTPNPGAQPVTSRGELYAYDRETKRYIRLSHTNDQVVGYVRSASGSEVAVIGFDKIDVPKKAKDAAAKDDGKDAPTLAHSFVIVYDTKTWKAIGSRIGLGAAKEVSVGYGAGDQLLVATDATVSSVDRTTGKLTKVSTALPEPRVAVSFEESTRVQSPNVKATWEGDITKTLETAQGGKVQIPETGAASRATIAVSDARIAFATAVDPCAKDSAPSLYVADAKTGTLKHVLTAKSRFATRWIEPTTLAYEDGEGAIRVWDATAGREVGKIENKVGIGLDALSLAPTPTCKQAPVPVEPGAGSGSAGSDDTMPPEEPSGPATAPK